MPVTEIYIKQSCSGLGAKLQPKVLNSLVTLRYFGKHQGFMQNRLKATATGNVELFERK
jgi:hypothetical protein